MHSTRKKSHTFKSGFVQIKEALHQLFCSSLLFCFPRKSKLEVRVLKLDSQFSKTLRIEFWVETVNWPLSGTILCNHAVVGWFTGSFATFMKQLEMQLANGFYSSPLTCILLNIEKFTDVCMTGCMHYTFSQLILHLRCWNLAGLLK